MLFPTEQVLSYNSSGNNCVTLNGFIYGNNKQVYKNLAFISPSCSTVLIIINN